MSQRIKPCQLRLSAVLEDGVYADISLVRFFAVEVCDKKRTSALVKQLNELYPIPEFDHLKRVKSGSEDSNPKILVAPVKLNSHEFERKLKSCIDFTGLGKLSIVQVCCHKPKTRCQYQAAAKHWPTHFHENKRLEKALRGELFSSQELLQIESLILDAVTEAESATSTEKQGQIDGAVVVDPLTNTVIARGLTDPTHPLKHAVMVVLDNIATKQDGGAWSSGKASLLQVDSNPLDLNNVQRTVTHPMKEQPCSQSSANSPQVAEKKSSLISDSLLVAPDLINRGEQGSEHVSKQDLEGRLYSEPPEAKRLKISTQQYLCTGYDMYTTKEPCIMCSMALVHSRISRVFYGRADKNAGGLGSKYKIHLQEGLNHHFEVYHST